MNIEEFEEVVLNKNNNELIKFIDDNLVKAEDPKNRILNKIGYYNIRTKKEKSVMSLSKENYKTLEESSLFTINHTIARMNVIIEGFNSIGTMSLIISLFVLYMTIYETMAKEALGNMIGGLVIIIMICIIIMQLSKNLNKDKRNMLIAVYLKTLMEAIKKEKEMKLKEQIEQVKKQEECIKQKQTQTQIEQKLLWIKKENE